jgi:hypothetical protein
MLRTPSVSDYLLASARSGFTSEERFCDALAASLLMPRSWILEHYGSSGQTLPAAHRLAAECQTSLSASVIRLREVVGWRTSLLRWRRANGNWRFVSAVGVPPRLRGRIANAPPTAGVLEACMRETRGSAPWSLPLRLNGVERSMPAQIGVRGASAAALITF